MTYVLYEFDAGPEDIIQVQLTRRANVRLLDKDNFQKYDNRQQHSYYGGHATFSPVNLTPPHYGHWYLVVDLGGYPGRVGVSAAKIAA